MRGEEDFFSVARTMPLVALDRVSSRLCRDALVNIPFMPRDVTPWLTALRAYSVFNQPCNVCTDLQHPVPICTSFPL